MVSTARVARASDIPDVRLSGSIFSAARRGQPICASTNLGKRASRGCRAQDRAEPTPIAPRRRARRRKSRSGSSGKSKASAYSAEFKVPGRNSSPATAGRNPSPRPVSTPRPTLLAKAAPELDPDRLSAGPYRRRRGSAPVAGRGCASPRRGVRRPRPHRFRGAGDGVDLGFGGDDKIKIQRAPVNRKENEPTWLNQTRSRRANSRPRQEPARLSRSKCR